MLTAAEIKHFMDEDAQSVQKQFAKIGLRYYNGDHDIKDYRMFYYNSDGNLVEDKYRSNQRIPHPFFTEQVDQTVQYIQSGQDRYMLSDIPELQDELDACFNFNDEFNAELAEVLTGVQVKGCDYMYALKNADDEIEFQWADSMGVIEVHAKDTDANTEHVIYWYIDRIDKESKRIKRIQVWDAEKVQFFVQVDDGEIEPDESEKINPRPHILYQEDGKNEITYDDFGMIPFFRMDNNRKQVSALKPIKPLIDDYDLMASSLSNNLVDFDTPIHVVRGYEGDNLDELQKNLKTKKIVGVDAAGGVEVQTVDVPYAARQAKLELDEKNIYRFGMALNTSGLKDTNATTNIAIKAAYSLLDLKAAKTTIQLKQFLRKLLKVKLKEINAKNGTDYQLKDIRFEFKHEIMSNALENAQIALTEAQTEQLKVNTVLNVAAQIGDEAALKAICEALDLDFEEIKSKMKQLPEAPPTADARAALAAVVPEETAVPTTDPAAGGDMIE